MKEEYIQARLRKSTHTRLRDVQNVLVNDARGRRAAANPALLSGQVGLSDVIDELIGRFLSERDRQRWYKQRKRLALYRADDVPPELCDGLAENPWHRVPSVPQSDLARFEGEGGSIPDKAG